MAHPSPDIYPGGLAQLGLSHRRQTIACTRQPLMGFRQRLSLIEQWLTDYTEHPDFGRWGTRRDQVDYVVWAFKDEIVAKAFRAHLEMVIKLTDRQVLNRLAKRGY